MSNKVKNTKGESKKKVQRRQFFFKLMRGAGVSSLFGLLWGGYLNEAKSAPLVLRPPGAAKEDDFQSLCIRCGQCVEACQNRENKPSYNTKSTLKLSRAGDNVPIGTPFFSPRDVPCYMCTDIPCAASCPTDAIALKNLVNKNSQKPEIDKARMGLAVLNKETCIAYWGIQCDACYRACPLIDRAITLEYSRNERTGKHAMLIPSVSSDYCTGCGLCEHACVTEKAAIFVLKRDLAMGRVGSHYTKGWEEKDDARIQKAPKEGYKTKTKRSNKKAIDYLNNFDLN